MPVDPGISLQLQNPNPTNLISGFLDIGQKAVNLDQSRQTLGANVAAANANAQTAQANANVATQTQGPKISQAQSLAGTAAAQYSEEQLANMRAHFANAAQQLGPLANDPNLTQDKVTDVLTQTLKDSGAPPSSYVQAFQGMPDPTKITDPAAYKTALKGFVTDSLLRAQTAQTQLEKQYPAPSAVATNLGTRFVASGNPSLTGQVPGLAQGPAILPPNVAGQAVNGAPVAVNMASGEAIPITGAPAPGPGITIRGVPNPPPPPVPQMALPPNETPATLASMQAQRTAAAQSVANVGTEHNLNQTIFNLAGATTTGKMGEFGAKLTSILGHPLNAEGDHTSDFNTLGKYLARSTAANAQAMGLPNTNAGTALSAEASGTTNYDPITLQRIAILNEGMATGKTLYQQGVENAIKNGGPDAIGAVRDFTAKWGSTFDPTASALMQAIKSGNKPMQAMIVKEAGGLGSKGVAKLRDQIHAMYNLAGQQ